MDIRQVMMTQPLQKTTTEDMEKYKLQYASSDRPKVDKWQAIHDFLHGFGWHHDATNRFVYINDLCLLGLDNVEFSWREVDQELVESYYTRLQAPLEERHAKQLSWLREHPIQFKSMHIPKINKPWPTL